MRIRDGGPVRRHERLIELNHLSLHFLMVWARMFLARRVLPRLRDVLSLKAALLDLLPECFILGRGNRGEGFVQGNDVAAQLQQSMVRDGGRVMERKWFAILGLVVKQCNVPWKNKDQASEAVKLALGIVNLSKTVGGDFMAYPKSLVELSDPELDEAVRDMMDLIQKMTGIDPATLKKEAADVGEDEQEPVDDFSVDGGSGEAAPSPSTAADTSAEAGMEAGDIGAADGQSASSASEFTTADCLKAFMITSTDTALSVADRRDVLEQMKDWWKELLPDHLDFVRACLTTADKIVKGELQADAARRYLEGLL